MMKRVLVAARNFAWACAFSVAGGAQFACALDIDFENPPYTSGTILGQNGWATNAYVLADPFFGGVVNGTVDISTTSPLSGAQSVLYTQTVDPPTAGGTGASDIGSAGLIVAREDGTSAVDLRASVLLQSDANNLANGSMGFFIGQGGRSPVILLITNASSSGGTGDILVGDSAGLPDVGNYAAGSILEAAIGVDLDNQNYDLTVRNVTAGTPAIQLTGSGPAGRFPFFGGTIADDGDGMTYTLDASLLLRSGVGRADAMSLVAIPEPMAMQLGLLGLGACGLFRRTRR